MLNIHVSVCLCVWALSSKYPASNKKKFLPLAIELYSSSWELKHLPKYPCYSSKQSVSGSPSAVLSLSSCWCFSRDFVFGKNQKLQTHILIIMGLGGGEMWYYIFLKNSPKNLHYLWKVYSVIVKMIVTQYTNSVTDATGECLFMHMQWVSLLIDC